MDAVEAARSGHPGMPMGMADIAEVLWNDFLRFSPTHPEWHNRDRFVLSNGHGSMLLYAVAHLTGYAIGIDEIKRFRQLGSRTAGHPEREPSIGIETTTGPLGQGLANAVGLAIAERGLAAEFNRPGLPIVDHRTYVFLGDGCLMEGISHEACSLAGTLGLGKLIAVYDDNGISIDGSTNGWFTDDTPARFRAYGWHVIADIDGHDPVAVAEALHAAQANTTQPTLICCKTIIGFGAPKLQGTAATHGAPLGAEEVAAARKELGWTSAPFEIPRDVLDAWDARSRGEALHGEWMALLEQYRRAHPEVAAEYERRASGKLPQDWSEYAAKAIKTIAEEAKSTATRQASQRALEAFTPVLPELLGGSADLTGSNNTKLKQSVPISRENAGGDYLYYGVREFAMAAIMNGIALHGGFIPYGGTFLVFSDYARNALRMAALMRLRSILVLTHDSIGLGEDGPTHQPIEHLAGLRAIPSMDVWRPCDAVETAVAWRAAIERQDGPTSLVLTRQGLPHVERTRDQIECIAKGGYILRSTAERPALILLATGSEIALVLAAYEQLREEHEVRLVSMPCIERFDAQEESYRTHVLPASVPVLAVEAATPDPWWRFAGEHGAVMGMRCFGASAPGKVLFEHFGFTVNAVIDAAQQVLRRGPG
jgi:transketolase